ncbi:dual specificity protein phosphatase 13B-like isoform X1 [Athene noctua]|uniref:dual specificity protein phosphatase 13B-like isoform X1 n=1 Tax=Athene noctua TaxID=126797 RepID=UPI003EB77DDE
MMPHTRDSPSPTSSAGSRASYETPALSDLQRLFWFRGGSDNHVDQVWPNIYLGDAWAARSKTTLQSLNITHILNAADGPYSINTGAKYYEDLQIEYYGVEAFDDPSFDLSIFFYDAANFIGKALNTSGGKVFVHCAMGVSRSASLVLAFLMIHENMTLVDALKTEMLWKMLLKRKVGSQLRLQTAAWAAGAGKHLTTKFYVSQTCLTV